MNKEKYIAAFEIGSSKITVAVGRAGDDGRLSIIAVEQEHTVECVCHGVIQNVEETASILSSLIARIEKRTGISPRKITKAYVGLEGRSLRNVPREISMTLSEDTEITEEIIERLRQDALHAHIDSSLEVIDAVPCTYFVNKSETRNAIGTFGSSIRARYQLIAARPKLRKLTERVVRDKAGISVAGMVVTPLAVADLILTSEEKRLGCMLVDMGAETTTVAIFRGGALFYLAVLPMGGRSITTDITSLNLLEERAEEIKTTSGNAIPGPNPSTLNLDGVKLSDVADLVAARAEEIVANIIEQITYAGITDKQLPGGIVTIGGGFNLNRMAELLKRQSGLNNVRRGTLPPTVTIEDIKAPTYEAIEVASIMHTGMKPEAPQCLEIPVRQELPAEEFTYTEEESESLHQRPKEPQQRERTRRFGLIDSIRSGLSNMFRTADEDDDTEID